MVSGLFNVKEPEISNYFLAFPDCAILLLLQRSCTFALTKQEADATFLGLHLPHTQNKRLRR